MTLPVRPHAALAVPSLTGIEPERFLRLTRDSLKRFDAPSGEAPKASVRHSAVASDTLMVKIDIDISPRDGARIVFRVAPRPRASAPCIDKSVEILSDIVLHALQFVDATHVEWLDERTLLSPEEFQSSFSYVSPKRARREMVDAPITERSVDEIEESLSRMFESSPPVTEPGHGAERAARVAAARQAAQDTLKTRRDGGATDPDADADALSAGTIPGRSRKSRTARDADIDTDADIDAMNIPDDRPSLLQRIAVALHLRRLAQVSALGGVGLALWKTGVFAPVLDLVGG
ncbi:hypothetical protein [Roseivivax sp. CAU 1753]